jgi:lysophospholipase L1-like esterase
LAKVINCILLVSSLFFILLLSEVGFRIVAYRKDLNTLDNIDAKANIPHPGEIVTLGRMIRLSKNQRIIYELIPNLSVIIPYKILKKNLPVTINSDGFRGKSIPIHKSPQSIRIVGIGDSLMFGWGVKDEEVYLSILSELLNSNYPKFSWEFINMAVEGYNTVMEVETLKEKGLQYKPDIVIIHYAWNDFFLPRFIREQEDYFALNQSFIIKYFRKTLKTIKAIRAPRNFSDPKFAFDPQKAPKQYRDMVGIRAYNKAMKELQSLSIKHKFDVVVLAYEPSENIKNISLQLGFHMLDFTPLWEKYASKQNFLDAEAAWRIHKDDSHPSVIAHKFIAETLSTMLVQLSGKNRKP